jgi:anti-sigma B factor antagonist
MTIDVSDRAGIKIVRLTGELRSGIDDEFVPTVTGLLAGRGTRVVLDLTHVPLISSTGLGDLVRVNAQANVQESRVVLCELSPFVAGVLQTTRLDRFFEVCGTLDEAIALLQVQKRG